MNPRSVQVLLALLVAAQVPPALRALQLSGLGGGGGRLAQDPDDFATSLGAEITSTLSGIFLVDAEAGTYNGCQKPNHQTFWVYLTGHLRSFDMHLDNLFSFLRQSSPCWFAAVYTRAEFDVPNDPSKPWNPDSGPYVEERVQQGLTPQAVLRQAAGIAKNNFAWAVVGRSNDEDSGDLHRGAVIVGQAVAKEHGLALHPRDVIAVTRPDLVFSHALDVGRLAAVAAEVPFVMMPHHEVATVGGNDPSEMLVVGVRDFWRQSCLFHGHGVPTNGVARRERLGLRSMTRVEGGAQMCLELDTGCGFYANPLIYGAAAMGFRPFIYNTDIKIHLHRLNGEFDMCVMRPCNTVGLNDLSEANGDVIGTVDITRGAICVLGDPSACAAEDPAAGGPGPNATCGGATSWAQLEELGEGLWRCQDLADVDAPCPA